MHFQSLYCVLFPPAPPGSPGCPAGQFPCGDSVGCVDASARCDGQNQCPTGSDEENCAATEGCLDSDWTCQNRMCIPKELRCNGLNDCMDNSDEEDCGEKDEKAEIYCFFFFFKQNVFSLVLNSVIIRWSPIHSMQGN